MNARLILANIFNLIDALLTLWVIDLGIGIELNPVMALLLSTPILFIALKVGVMFLLTMWVSKNKDKFSNIASWIMCISMFVISCWNSIPIIIFYMAKGGII